MSDDCYNPSRYTHDMCQRRKTFCIRHLPEKK